MRVTELITLKVTDLNQRRSYVICRDGEKERVIPYGPKAQAALETYLKDAREELLKGTISDLLFVNCSRYPHAPSSPGLLSGLPRSAPDGPQKNGGSCAA